MQIRGGVADWYWTADRSIGFCAIWVCISSSSSLVNTLPITITKKNKYTVVAEAHKECTYAAYTPANLLQKANSGSNWRLSSERVGGTEWTECSFVCHVPGTRGISPGYFFCPSRALFQCFLSGAGRQPISASPVLFLANGVWITWL